jgi:DNA-binding LacI/PurR family transcriptional regulator
MSHIMPAIEWRAGERSVKIQKYGVEFFRALTVDEGGERIVEGGYDGILLMVNGVVGDEREFNIVKASGLPVVMPYAATNDYETTGFAAMHTDDREGFGAAIKTLAAQGHKRVGTVFLPADKRKVIRGYSSDEYRDLLKRNNLDSSIELIHHCSYCYQDISNAVVKLMRLSAPPSAIMCYSDFVALHVYKTLRDMKIRIPSQVAVMGYCNYPGGELLSPSLSTVDLFFEQIGRDALDLLMDSGKWWKRGITPPYITTPFKVIERGSTNVKMLEKELVETILF